MNEEFMPPCATRSVPLISIEWKIGTLMAGVAMWHLMMNAFVRMPMQRVEPCSQWVRRIFNVIARMFCFWFKCRRSALKLWMQMSCLFNTISVFAADEFIRSFACRSFFTSVKHSHLIYRLLVLFSLLLFAIHIYSRALPSVFVAHQRYVFWGENKKQHSPSCCRGCIVKN